MELREIITELIRKECEAYRLTEFGLLVSVEAGVERLMPLINPVDPCVFEDPIQFRDWRKKVLSLFYEQLGYAGFIKEEKERLSFRHFLFCLKKRIIGRLHEQYQEPTIDKDLAIPPHTLAFKLSAMLADEQFEKELPFLASAVCSPSEVEVFCRESCRTGYPIGLEELFVRLKKEDTEFWNDLYLTVKRIAGFVTSGQSVSIQYRKEILLDTWGDASLLLHEKVTEGATPIFETALHFRNYIARICLNKCREAVRRNNQPEVSLTVTGDVPDAALLLPDAADLPDARLLAAGGLEDIDCENEEEVGQRLTIILWDKEEPWYTALTRGIEEKTELIFLHYVEGMSYEAIAGIRGAELSGKERKRLENKLRQDVVRTRRLLKQRFVEILKKNRMI